MKEDRTQSPWTRNEVAWPEYDLILAADIAAAICVSSCVWKICLSIQLRMKLNGLSNFLYSEMWPFWSRCLFAVIVIVFTSLLILALIQKANAYTTNNTHVNINAITYTELYKKSINLYCYDKSSRNVDTSTSLTLYNLTITIIKWYISFLTINFIQNLWNSTLLHDAS